MDIGYFFSDPHFTPEDRHAAPIIHAQEMILALRGAGCCVSPFFLAEAASRRRTSEPRALDSGAVRPAWFLKARSIIRDFYEIQSNLGDARVLKSFLAERPLALAYARQYFHKTKVSKLCRISKIPLILEVNSPAEERRLHFGAAQSVSARLFLKMDLRRSDAVVVVSTPLKRYCVRLGVPAHKVHVLPNAVNENRFPPPPASESKRGALGLESKTVIGFVGTSRSYHGLEFLIPLARSLALDSPEVRFLLVGKGSGENGLVEGVRAEKLASFFTFVEAVPHEDMASYLAAMDICLLPRFSWYGSPMKLLEYAAAGKAIVAPDQDNIRDVVEHGASALLFEPGNQSAFSGAVKRLVENPDLRGRLGETARTHVLTHHTWAKNAAAVLEIYRGIVSSRDMAFSRTRK